MINLIVVRGVNFSFHLRRKVFNWSLSPLYGQYKNKRPPPVAA